MNMRNTVIAGLVGVTAFSVVKGFQLSPEPACIVGMLATLLLLNLTGSLK